ncbi:PsbP-related protein [Methanobacterium paludis]|uniref:PsbP C-terminal domain-containing protein n=1 Tax=Methanobacterium paludis (strain DSM 25820 / JCM 18151 / SWAN1) TaxID=868131 RepID=F6D2Q5_METPW|nr:PsbP-related protein [Methanobacterium paludis]AEG18634.1 hypothetical protein MSWAN_1623 [Methanobacterium paludis]
MKKRYIILVFILAVAIFFIMGSASTTSYSNKYYSFEYPHNWTKENDTYNAYESTTTLYPNYSDLKGKVNIVLTGPEEEPNNYSINDSRDLFIYTNSKVFPNASYFEDKDLTNDPEFKVLMNKTVTINGMNGFDVVIYDATPWYLNSPHEIIEEVMLQKGNKIYTLKLTCSPEALAQDPNIFNSTHREFETVANSFKVT